LSRNITAVILALAVIFYLLISTPLIAQTAEEDTAPEFEFTILEDDELLEDSFEDNITARLYAFFGSEGDEITLSMAGQFDSYLVLFGEEGQFLMNADEGGEKFGDSLLEDFELPYDGTYYVLATTFDYLDAVMVDEMTLRLPLDYEIVLTGNTLPEDFEENPVPKIVAPSLESGETNGELTAESPIGYFSFEAEEGDVVDLSFNFDKLAAYPMLYLFAPDGSRIAISEALDGTSEADVLGFELPIDGSYLVAVMDTFFVDIDQESGDYGLGTFTLNYDISS
jgi:hypothetical protein